MAEQKTRVSKKIIALLLAGAVITMAATAYASLQGLAGLPIIGDHDGDGIPNYKDPHPNVHEDNFKDFDGDGIPNYKDPHPNVHEDNFDSDGDGIPDYKDPHPNVPEEEWNLKHTDSDGDGMSDWFEKNIANLDPNVPNDRYVLIKYLDKNNLTYSWSTYGSQKIY